MKLFLFGVGDKAQSNQRLVFSLSPLLDGHHQTDCIPLTLRYSLPSDIRLDRGTIPDSRLHLTTLDSDTRHNLTNISFLLTGPDEKSANSLTSQHR